MTGFTGLTPAQQHGRMLAVFGGRFAVKFRRSRAVWIGDITPWEGCAPYHVEIEYRIATHPVLRVISPALIREREGKVLEHKYGDERCGLRPCLYEPFEWNSRMAIADTIVPWAIEWLFFYEVWLATGEWIGGGSHPHKKEPIVAERSKTYAPERGP